jgi:hypothetical protein
MTYSVKEANSVTKKTQLQRYLTKKYDVLEIAGIEKLVRKGTDVIYYCTTEEELNALTQKTEQQCLQYINSLKILTIVVIK